MSRDGQRLTSEPHAASGSAKNRICGRLFAARRKNLRPAAVLFMRFYFAAGFQRRAAKICGRRGSDCAARLRPAAALILRRGSADLAARCGSAALAVLRLKAVLGIYKSLINFEEIFKESF